MKSPAAAVPLGHRTSRSDTDRCCSTVRLEASDDLEGVRWYSDTRIHLFIWNTSMSARKPRDKGVVSERDATETSRSRSS